jgi:type III secretion protein O
MSTLATYTKLRRIKAFREERAAGDLRRRQAVVAHAAKALTAAREQHAAHRDARLAREHALFAEIQGKAVGARDIEAMNQRVAALREREAQLQTAVLDADKALADAKQALADARAEHALRRREVEKFDKLLEVARARAEQERQTREENELEDAVGAGYGRHRRAS